MSIWHQVKDTFPFTTELTVKELVLSLIYLYTESVYTQNTSEVMRTSSDFFALLTAEIKTDIAITHCVRFELRVRT